MKANLKRSKGDVRKWSRWIGGAALVLALAGPLAPTTTSAEINEGETVGHEVIPVEGTAPWTPPNWGGHTGTGAPNGTPSGDSGGGGGGVSVPSKGSTGSSTRQKRIAGVKADCLLLEGVWGRAVFNDIVTNIRYSGYSCRLKSLNGKYEWRYYDSEGNYNHQCSGDLEVQTCEE